MKKKRILLGLIVVLVMAQAAWLIWLAVNATSGARPFQVSDGLFVAGQVFFDIYVFSTVHRYWNSQKGSE